MSLRETPSLSLDDAIRARRSVRGFLPDEVPEPVLREAFELAQLAPSNCNAQPWTPHVVSGEAWARLRAALFEAAKAERPIAPDYEANWKFSGVYRERQVDAALQLYGAMGVERRDVAGRQAAYLRNFVGFDAPHIVFVFMAAGFGVREAADVGMWAQTLMLALAARGVASCAQGAMSLYPDIVRAELGIGPELKLLFGISFGYEDTAVRANGARVGRAALDAAVRFHR
jgi:nitroreductase